MIPWPMLPGNGSRARVGRRQAWPEVAGPALRDDAEAGEGAGGGDVAQEVVAHRERAEPVAVEGRAHERLVRGEDLDPLDRSIDVHVSRIRLAIEDDPQHPTRIVTVRGAGYVFSAAGERRS